VTDKYEIEIDGAGHGSIRKNGEIMTGAKSFVLRGGAQQLTTINIEFSHIEAKAAVEIGVCEGCDGTGGPDQNCAGCRQSQ